MHIWLAIHSHFLPKKNKIIEIRKEREERKAKEGDACLLLLGRSWRVEVS
jgi:hypothetical protein